jgi:hypothetical protein
MADAKDELDDLQKRFDTATRVEIIRFAESNEDGVVVYASGQFEKGKYFGSSNNWSRVDLPIKGTKACKLSDLDRCNICVGGGFPFVSIHKNLDHWRDVVKCVGDCPIIIATLGDWHRTKIRFCIHGCPKEAWLPWVQNDHTLPRDNLAKEIAPYYPNATIEFVSVRFWLIDIHGAFNRLLTPRRREEAKEEARARAKRRKEGKRG